MTAARKTIPRRSLGGAAPAATRWPTEINYRWASTEDGRRAARAPGAPVASASPAAAAMLLDMSSCAASGFFDESFFLCYEDDDLCVRIFRPPRHPAGARCAWCITRADQCGAASRGARIPADYHPRAVKIRFAAKLPVGRRRERVAPSGAAARAPDTAATACLIARAATLPGAAGRTGAGLWRFRGAKVALVAEQAAEQHQKYRN